MNFKKMKKNRSTVTTESQQREGAFYSQGGFVARRSFKETISGKRRVPFIQQLSAAECGAACLAMILSYHGRQTSVAECRDICQPGRDGLTAQAVAQTARQFGLRVKAYSLEPDKLSYLPLPLIAHWEFNHFVVIESWSPKKVRIVDPAVGRLSLTPEEFDRGFTGVVLTFEPGVHFAPIHAKPEATWPNYLRSLLWLSGAKTVFAQVILASLAIQVFGLALPTFTKILFDRVLPLQITNLLTILGVGLLLVVVATAIVSYLRSSLLIYLRGKFDSHLMLGFFEHLLSLPFSFFQKRASGDLLMRLGSNSFIRDMLTNQTITVILDGSFALTYLAIIFAVAPFFGLVVAGLGILQALVVLGMGPRVRNLMKRELVAKAEEQSYLVEAMTGVSILKASGAEDRAFERWSDLFYNQLNVSLERGYLSVLVETGMGILRLFSPLVLLWLGATYVLEGEMSLGMMLALNSLAASFFSPITSLVTSAQQFQLAVVHLERITDVLETEPEQVLYADRKSSRITGRIEVRRLSFRYHLHAPMVLTDLSFSIEPGQKIALVGPTGSGKSTLALLLLGLYRPTEGEIRYDDLALEEFDLRALRRQLGVVLQNSFLFSGSIRQNITLNDPSAPFDKVVEAAKLACINQDISRMPMGYETIIAEGGNTLSGGQRQRLAIARALLHRPAALILDEATSHLDARTESEVDRHLNSLSCTRIIMAHRLSTIRNADQIVVLDAGCISERGTHDELIGKGGYYAALVQSQLDSDSTEVLSLSQV